MEKKIKKYFGRVRHLQDEKIRASFMLELLTVEKDDILGLQDNDKKYGTLDEALDRYYKMKEYRFTKTLLENYILKGNFDLSSDKEDIVHRLDKFKRISDTLTSLFPSFSVVEK